MYSIYVDDSGDQTNDLLSAIAVPHAAWGPSLMHWKKWRVWLDNALGIPARAEFHSEVIMRRGDVELEDRFGKKITLTEPLTSKRNTRQAAFVKGLKTLNSLQGELGLPRDPVTGWVWGQAA